MSLHEMSYIPANRDIPYGMVTSTARKGDKWMKAQPGDTLELYVSDGTEREFLGNAIVTKVELVNYVAVLHRAKENHVVQTSLPEDVRASEVLGAHCGIRPMLAA
jgi:hypothetical protein